jgi:hypothetical protein
MEMTGTGTGNGSGAVTVDVPAGSLTIDAAGGSDSIALAAGLDLATSLILAGGAGTDAATLDGTLASLAVHADIESVADSSTTATLSFVGTDGDDAIKATIAAAGAIEPLVALVRDGDAEGKANAAGALDFLRTATLP